MNRAELLALAERVEGLTGPCRETDAAIYLALNPHMLPVPFDETNRFYDPSKTDARTASKFFLGGGATGVALRFTASIDAAMTLVPEGWWLSGIGFNHTDFRSPQDREWGAFVSGPVTWAVVEHGMPEEPLFDDAQGGATTPALALTAAALRARAGEASDDR